MKYDRIFWKNYTGVAASWDVLDPSLLTIVADQGIAPQLPCHYCQELDHTSSECALAPLEQPTKPSMPGRQSSYSCGEKCPAPYEVACYGSCYQPPHDPQAAGPAQTSTGLHDHASAFPGIRDNDFHHHRKLKKSRIAGNH